MSAPAKKLLWTATAIYVVGVVIGMVLFRSPNLSRAYLDKYGADHARYLSILKDEEYLLYAERPALHPSTPELQEKNRFVEEYEARPEFVAEHHRVLGYVWYFRAFNSLFFIGLIVVLSRKPLLAALDTKVQDIHTTFVKAEAEAQAGADEKTKAQAELDRWVEVEEGIRHHTDDAIDEEITAIREEFRNARVQLYKTTEDRKTAEYLRVARQLQEELVEKSLTELEQRYRRETGPERLESSVDEFVQLLDQLT